MERLWAPWRMGYIKNFKKEKGCLFCRVYKTKDDGKDFVLARTRRTVTLLNLYPYTNGHVMVAPARHLAAPDLLTGPEMAELMEAVVKIKKALDRALKPEGYNIGLNIGRSAGAGFDRHLHVHVVPRWNGDTNFMPTLAATKVISQSLNALYDELKRRLR